MKSFLLKVIKRFETCYLVLINLFSFNPSLSLLLDWEDGATANKIELSAAFTEDWDDQTVEDDFANQLRAELQKLNK